MRDVIWTLITVWLIYKLVDLFRSISAKKSYVNTQQSSSRTQYTEPQAPASKKDLKKAIQKHLNNDGEYVDFEEVK